MPDLSSLFAGYPTSSLAEYVAKNEGFGKKGKPGQIYVDTMGKRTVGYGFNIDDPYIRSQIPADVVSGRRPMQEVEAMPLLQKFIDNAQKDAISLVGADVFNNLSDSQKIAFTDVVYNLGRGKASGFEKTIKAIKDGDFNTAGMELLKSNYAKQVGDRALRNSRMLSGSEVAVKKNVPHETPISFKDAFSSARASGKKVFEYKGKKYTTEVKK
jgi:GH24 family phage-related lysozyme (muramidase)